MTPRGYDYYLVHRHAGREPLLRRRFSVPERYCFFLGVLAVAAGSPIRGYLLLADDEPSTAEDVAEECGVSVAVAKSTLEKMRRYRMLEVDEDTGWERVTKWDEHQPTPRRPSDDPVAARERKRLQRERERDMSRGVTRDTERDSHASHAGKGREGEEKTPTSGANAPDTKEPSDTVSSLSLSASPSRETEGQTNARARNDDPEYGRLSELLAVLIAENDPHGKSPSARQVEAWRNDVRLMVEQDGRDLAGIEACIRWSQAHHFWRGPIKSMGNLRQHYAQMAQQAQADRTSSKGRRQEETMLALKAMEDEAA